MAESHKKETKPNQPQRLLAWRDFPPTNGTETFDLTDEFGNTRRVTLGKGNLRVIKALIDGPIYRASPVRTSNGVLILKRDDGVGIRTDMFTANDWSDRDRYGVYTLTENVFRVAQEAA